MNAKEYQDQLQEMPAIHRARALTESCVVAIRSNAHQGNVATFTTNDWDCRMWVPDESGEIIVFVPADAEVVEP